ncbi:MAG: hypothetical protein ACE37F_24885 [Nannocystaceae bacterium]|nr:hypothetical protein [bacterium]
MKRGLSLALVLSTGCAQLETTTTVEVVPRPELDPKWLGNAKTVVGRDLTVQWSQSLSTLEFEVHESRRCRAVLHEPVDRVESIDHTVKHGGLYWEYGIGAALLAVGLAALIRPEAFSNRAVDEGGNTSRDTTTGYRLGGIFTALGAGVVGIGVYDTVRSRDSVQTTRAYRLTSGHPTPCISPSGPRSATEVEIVIGPWTASANTDAQGRVQFGLPGEDELGVELPPAPPPAATPGPGAASDVPAEGTTEAPAPAPAPDPAPIEVEASIHVGGQLAEFTIVAPLATAEGRGGTLSLRPPGVPSPGATP